MRPRKSRALFSLTLSAPNLIAICGQCSSRSACASLQSDPTAKLSANLKIRVSLTYERTVDAQADLDVHCPDIAVEKYRLWRRKGDGYGIVIVRNLYFSEKKRYLVNPLEEVSGWFMAPFLVEEKIGLSSSI